MRGNAWVVARGDEPLTFTRCCSYKKPLKGGIQSAAKHKGIKGKFILYLLALLIFYFCSFLGIAACRPCGSGIRYIYTRICLINK